MRASLHALSDVLSPGPPDGPGEYLHRHSNATFSNLKPRRVAVSALANRGDGARRALDAAVAYGRHHGDEADARCRGRHLDEADARRRLGADDERRHRRKEREGHGDISEVRSPVHVCVKNV